ncbi:MAG: DNA N-glycosylase and apurinic/apyrimidinic (AP) lyase [Sclerophora amabilis]|nr:MAG: DNA N-glycosylase and apurinic/apyrimidinic (AP) lyase [Sclerophora amabilis]
MRTSRIAHETARITKSTTSPSPRRATRRQTRTFAQSLSGYHATGTTTAVAADGAGGKGSVTAAGRTDSDTIVVGDGSESHSESEESTADGLGDANSSSARKRKRGSDTPLTTESGGTAATTTTTPAARSRPPRRPSAIRTSTIGVVETSVDDAMSTPNPPRASKIKRQPARKTVNADGQVEIHPPLHWREVYDTVKDMRSRILAPVDTMGCETLADPNAAPKDQRFQTLVALMLSSQTRDTTTSATMQKLQSALAPQGGLTVSNIRALPAPQLDTLIYQVGFHNTKTRHLKAVAEILADEHDGDVPDSKDALVALPGVGPKMAFLCLAAAWDKVEGIGVDVHVHRITNLWRWHGRGSGSGSGGGGGGGGGATGTTKGPEETRRALEQWLPRDLWHEINHLLVGFGQTVCLPQRPKCWECDLGARGLCPAARRGGVAGTGKTRTHNMQMTEEHTFKEGGENATGTDYPVKKQAKHSTDTGIDIDNEMVIKEEPVQIEDDAPAAKLKQEPNNNNEAVVVEDIENLGSGMGRTRVLRSRTRIGAGAGT